MIKEFLQQLPQNNNYRSFYDLDILRLTHKEKLCFLKATGKHYLKQKKNIFAFVFEDDYAKDTLCELILILKLDEKLKLYALKKEYSNNFNVLITPYKYLYQITISTTNNKLFSVQDIVNDLLSVFLVTGRPVIGYNSTFYTLLDINHADDQGQEYKQQFDIRKNDEASPSFDFSVKNISSASGLKEHQQVYLYFNDNVRDYIYQTSDTMTNVDPIEEYTLDIREENYRIRTQNCLLSDVTHKQSAKEKEIYYIKVEMSSNQDEDIIAQVHKVSLLKYYNKLFLMTLEVRLPDELELFIKNNLSDNDNDWWYSILTANYSQLIKLQACHWLDFTYYTRILYPSFHQQDIECKFKPLSLIKKHQQNVQAKEEYFWQTTLRRYNLINTDQGIKLGEEINTIALYFVKQFFDQSEEDIKQRLCHIDDDRQFCNTVYTLMGNNPQTMMAKEQYRRLFSLMLYVDRSNDTWDKLNQYAYTPNFVHRLMQDDCYTRWEGLGTLSGYTNYSNVHCGYTGFYKDNIADVHISFIYGRMLTLCLFYKMTLKMHSRSISRLTDNKDKNKYSKITKNILEFTNRYYFQEITSQIQGQEIFEKQTKALKIQQEFIFLKEEINWSDEYYDKENNNKENKVMFVLTFAAVIISLITLKDYADFGRKIIKPLFTHAQNLYLYNSILYWVGTSGIILSLVLFFRKKNK